MPRAPSFTPLLAVLALAACGDEGGDPTGGGGPSAVTSGTGPGGGGGGGAAAAPVLDLAAAVDAEGEGEASVTVAVDGESSVTIRLGGAERIVEIDAAHQEPMAIELDAGSSLEAVDVGTPPAPPAARAGGTWIRPRPVGARDPVLRLRGTGEVTIRAWSRGGPVPRVRRERSLVWLDPEVLDDPTIVGPARLLGAIGSDGHGGRLLDAWFRRFATTIHSERAGPAQLMDEWVATYGPDPSVWDLDALPFRVTGVHDRLDLAAQSGGCGEVRVSLASTHPIVAPLHLLFLFQQPPGADDVAPDGTVHCLGTARRWARLSGLDGPAFVDAARAWLDEAIDRDRFLLAETVELTVSPWEWRQWVPVGPDQLDNPPLFQTVATAEVNAPGPLRDDFLAFVADRAASLDDRTEPLPERFRRASARVPPGAPAERLSLAGLDPGLLAAYPDLARNVEIVGCPTCHTETAEFVQTSVDREVSPFYDVELDARGARLDRLGAGVDEPAPPFGPLQD